MSVMRQQQDSILTLLEVLLYDPLYVWAVTPKRAAAVQEKQRNKRRSAQAAVPEAADESGKKNKSLIFKNLYFGLQ
jgi:ataxia telangiectasia mutated family protein